MYFKNVHYISITTIYSNILSGGGVQFRMQFRSILQDRFSAI